MYAQKLGSVATVLHEQCSLSVPHRATNSEPTSDIGRLRGYETTQVCSGHVCSQTFVYHCVQLVCTP